MKRLVLASAFLVASTLTANAETISGNYTLTSNANPQPTITYILGQPFSFDLDLNVPQTVALATIYENIDSGTTTVTAAFNFADPTVATGSISATDVYSSPGASHHDQLTWNDDGLLTVNFSDGAIVEITLSNEKTDGSSYNGVHPSITFNLVAAPHTHKAPEPWTLSLVGAGLMGLGGANMLRRRRARQAI